MRLRVAPLHAAQGELLPLAQQVRVRDAQVLVEHPRLSEAGVGRAGKPL